MRDTIHLLQIIDDIHVNDGTQLVAIDVEDLYSANPHDRGLKVIRHVLFQSTQHEPQYNEFVLMALEFIPGGVGTHIVG